MNKQDDATRAFELATKVLRDILKVSELNENKIAANYNGNLHKKFLATMNK